MLFNSFEFICLFPIGALIYALLRTMGNRLVSQAWLLLLSIGFYSFSSFRVLPLLIGSILFNWAVARVIGDESLSPQWRSRWMLMGVSANVLFLGLFKYLNLFLSALHPVFGIQAALPNWALPLGVSFFTLNQVMYLVDCYQGVTPASSLFDHAAFVSFFPYLVAGPLTRAKPMIQQFHKAVTPLVGENVARGFALFAIGLVKKTVFADSLVRLADTSFLDPLHTSALETWISVVAYSLQIYFDFSGYSDMAVGVARILGYDIPYNFNSPYKSRSITEFWQRWHISLSNFITSYLYTPILRAFKGRATVAKAAVAAILAMTISGLWHGPAWTFVIWGLCHGLALAINLFWRKKLKMRMPSVLGWATTFLFVVVVEIFFRAPSLEVAFQVIHQLLPWQGLAAAGHVSILLGLESLSYVLPSLVALPLALLGPSSQEIVAAIRPLKRLSFAYALAVLISFVALNSVIAKAFVYFQF